MTDSAPRLSRIAQELYRQVRAVVEDAHCESLRAEYARGRADGYETGAAHRPSDGRVALDVVFVRDLRKLVHPDLHPARRDQATRACQRLNALLDEDRAAA